MYNLATILAVLIQPQRNKDVKYKSANSSLFRECEGGEEDVGQQREQGEKDKRVKMSELLEYTLILLKILHLLQTIGDETPLVIKGMWLDSSHRGVATYRCYFLSYK